MVDMAHFAGLVAGGVLTGDLNPVLHADVVTSTTHKSLRGPRGGFVLCTDEYAPFVDKGCPMVLGGPLPHVMAAKAIAFAEARQPSFAGYAAAIVANAQALADGLQRRGVRLVTGGTSNHLVLADVATSFGLTGRQAESALLDAGVVTNRNSIPRDANGAWYTSGIRMGTPALTTLGFGTRRARRDRRHLRRRARRDHARRGRVQGQVRPRRQGRRRQQGPLRRAARPSPALPRDRAVGNPLLPAGQSAERPPGGAARGSAAQYSVSMVSSAFCSSASGPRSCIIFIILPLILTLPWVNAFCPSSSPLLTLAAVS